MIEGHYEIRDGEKVILKGKNVITKIGKRIIGDILSSTKYISHIVISSSDNLGVETTSIVENYQELAITNSYSIVDSVTNNLIVVFESYGTSPTINSIKTIGIAIKQGEVNRMVTVSSQNNVNVQGLANTYVVYKLVLDF
jgi:hypothetical protein